MLWVSASSRGSKAFSPGFSSWVDSIPPKVSNDHSYMGVSPSITNFIHSLSPDSHHYRPTNYRATYCPILLRNEGISGMQTFSALTGQGPRTLGQVTPYYWITLPDHSWGDLHSAYPEVTDHLPPQHSSSQYSLQQYPVPCLCWLLC